MTASVMPSDIKKILRSVDQLPDQIVPCFIGPPGIGKTQGVYEYAEEKGAKVVEIIASQILPNEVSGITMPVAKSHSMEIYDHARLSSLEDGDILFFDELLQAPPQTLSACLTLIQERRLMSGKKLPDIMIVAAANPLNSPTMIPLSIRQRFMFVEVSFDRRSYHDYMLKRYGVDVNETLLKRIVSESDQYNALTPRTLTKLVAWALRVGKDDDGFASMVKTMFDEMLYVDIFNCIEKEDAKSQVVKAMQSFAGPGQGWTQNERDEVVEKILKANMKDILDIISTLDGADEILEYLGAMDYKE